MADFGFSSKKRKGPTKKWTQKEIDAKIAEFEARRKEAKACPLRALGNEGADAVWPIRPLRKLLFNKVFASIVAACFLQIQQKQTSDSCSEVPTYYFGTGDYK